MQKTGTNEEVTAFLYDMENLNSLAEVQSKDPLLRTQARERQKKLDDEGKLIRKHAMEAMTKTPRKRKLLDDTIDELNIEAEEIRKKIREVEAEEAIRHAEVIQLAKETSEAAKETTRAIQQLCQLWQNERYDIRELVRTFVSTKKT